MANKVENELSHLGILRGGLLLFDLPNSFRFINKCEAEKISILGLDGFILSEEKTQPSLADSIDFSTDHNIEGANQYEKAKNFLRSRADKNLYFEIVCDD